MFLFCAVNLSFAASHDPKGFRGKRRSSRLRVVFAGQNRQGVGKGTGHVRALHIFGGEWYYGCNRDQTFDPFV
ncbi:protein of unknown function [Kyrpidia spormannii]|uniref:Uncharacterized protein n=1 Tax=Kyrpidia spormannii TaxID=2055160 RepID=A0ACA8Z9L1_9BACL|nr:protein of unknown function [Kyrpidia spormannii]